VIHGHSSTTKACVVLLNAHAYGALWAEKYSCNPVLLIPGLGWEIGGDATINDQMH